jgi:hypothetical protein
VTQAARKAEHGQSRRRGAEIESANFDFTRHWTQVPLTKKY